MKPYYEADGITIYHGDCREILPSLPKFDLCLTDPPYGISRSGQPSTVCRNPKHNRKLHVDLGWDSERPGADVFALLFQCSDQQIIWGGNYFPEHLYPSMGWIVWDKGQDFSTSDCELAFSSYQKALRRVVCNRGAIAREGALHPTQKPSDVILFSFAYAGAVRLVVDPFMGSGTTLRVAKDLGISRAVGIEIEERYCEIAAKRLSQQVLELGAAPGGETRTEQTDD